MATRSILVVGSTGKQGGALVKSLLATPSPSFKLYALTRNAQSASAQRLARQPNVTIIEGDLNNPSAIFSQLPSTVHGVFAVTTPIKSAKVEEQQGKDLVDAAARHGVTHFVFTSVERGGPDLSAREGSVVPHFMSKYNIEKHLKAVAATSGMKWTIIAPVAFMDNLTPDFLGRAFATMWKLNGEDSVLQLVSSADVGRLAATVFRLHEEYYSKTLSFATDELSWKEADAVFKKVVGTNLPLTYGWVGSSIKLILNEQLGLMFRWFKDVGFGADPKEFSDKVEGLMNLERWLEKESKFVTNKK